MFRTILSNKKMRLILLGLIFIFTIINVYVGYELLTKKQVYKSKAEGVVEKTMVFKHDNWYADFVYRFEYPKFYWSLKNLKVDPGYKILLNGFLHVGIDRPSVQREGTIGTMSGQWITGDSPLSGEINIPNNIGCWFQLDVQMTINEINAGGTRDPNIPTDEQSEVGEIPDCISDIPTPTVTTPVAPTITPMLTNTPAPTATSTPGPTATPPPVSIGCGVKACDNTSNPCQSGLICVHADDGSNYCALPEYQTACKTNPSLESCCTAPGNTPTPTEIIVVQNTNTPQPTYVAAQPTVPSAGLKNLSVVLAIPTILLLLGLVF